MTDLSHPASVMHTLAQIENDLASRQNELENAAWAHFHAKREREAAWAREFISLEGTVADRKARADLAVADVGVLAEAKYEGLRAVVRVLETRATIGMAILKTQARA